MVTRFSGKAARGDKPVMIGDLGTSRSTDNICAPLLASPTRICCMSELLIRGISNMDKAEPSVK